MGTGVGVTVAVWVLFPRFTRASRDSASSGDATVSVWSPASPTSVFQPRVTVVDSPASRVSSVESTVSSRRRVVLHVHR